MRAAPMIVIVSSVHDYRMLRRGSIQAVADAFRRSGFRTVFLSVRFSALSLMRRDPRAFLRARANSFEEVNGVECYLWRTLLHPFATGSTVSDRAMAPMHDVYANWPNRDVDALLRQADIVLVESGLGLLLIDRARRLNPRALIIYRGSDPLDIVGAHPDLQRRLERSGAQVDQFCLLSRSMAPQFAFARDRTFLVPQAVHRPDFEDIGPNPYEGGRNAVSIGSMLFDPSFFDAAAAAHPEVTFHVIGCGRNYAGGGNVRVYREMPFAATLPYVGHADLGVAAYREAPAAHYLADSSLKLTQFTYLRRPAVCPHFAVGGRKHRFGYTPGNAQEIAAAIACALADRFDSDEPSPLSWDDIVPRLLQPGQFHDTRIAPEHFGV